MPTKSLYLKRVSGLVMILMTVASVAHAEPAPRHASAAKTTKVAAHVPPPACQDERPWYCGVSDADKEQALALYAQGNQLFDDSLFPAAVNRYREALTHWNHPGIHYNLMLALVALDEPIDAYRSSIEALRYGTAALEPDEHRRAQDYQKLLRGRVVDLTVACDEPGAVVTLDGKNILEEPGEVHLFVSPGQHELVARKPGYLPTHRALMLLAAEATSVQIRMLPVTEALISTRRWEAWQPWAVVGAGVGVGLAGGLLEWRAVANNDAFRIRFANACRAPAGCLASEYDDKLVSYQRRYRWYRGLGYGASVAGGAAAVTGLVFVYLNRAQQIENPERRHLVRLSTVPVLGADKGSIGVEVTF